MNYAATESLIKKHLHRIAPEADLDRLQADDNLRDQLNLDSMDFYTLMVAVSDERNIDIPEEEYGNLLTMERIAEFLARSVPPGDDT